jgi:hypothetical protein
LKRILHFFRSLTCILALFYSLHFHVSMFWIQFPQICRCLFLGLLQFSLVWHSVLEHISFFALYKYPSHLSCEICVASFNHLTYKTFLHVTCNLWTESQRREFKPYLREFYQFLRVYCISVQ